MKDEREGLGEVEPARRGDWIETYAGERFWPLDPRPEEVRLRDIAMPLSRLPRYLGHSLVFSSVAQHSVIVSMLCENAGVDPRAGLLHDAAEAYICDLPRPIKVQPEMQFFRDIEDRILRAVYARYEIPWETYARVKFYDSVALCAEASVVMYSRGEDWTYSPEVLEAAGRVMMPMLVGHQDAYTMFMARAHHLGIED
jgi:hypothetical protein